MEHVPNTGVLSTSLPISGMDMIGSDQNAWLPGEMIDGVPIPLAMHKQYSIHNQKALTCIANYQFQADGTCDLEQP
jgi:hypothetical protein